VRIEEGLLAGIAERSLFVIDEEQSVTYRWDAEPGELPDLTEVEAAIEAAR
jgi:peroxiredoxin